MQQWLFSILCFVTWVSREVLIKVLFFPYTQPFQMPLASVVSRCFAVPIVSADAPETCHVCPSCHQGDEAVYGAFYKPLNLGLSNFWLHD